MSDCRVQLFKNLDPSTRDILVSVIRNKVRARSRGKLTTLELLDYLSNEAGFRFSFVKGEDDLNNTTLRAYKENLKAVNDKVLGFAKLFFKLEADYKKFEQEYNDGLASATKMVDAKPSNTEGDEEVPDIPGVEQPQVKVKESLNTTLSNYYGDNSGALNYRQFTFNNDLFRALIIDKENNTLTVSERDLNLNIRRIKEKFYKLIYDYLKSKGLVEGLSETMFNKNGELQTYYELSTRMKKELDKLKNSDELYDKVNAAWLQSLLGKADPLLDALNAYVNLAYFDSFLKDTVGDFVNVRRGLNNIYGDITPNNYKYSFGQDNTGKVVRWGVSESVSGIDQVGKFSKIIVGLAPVKSFNTNRVYNKNLNTVSLVNAFTNLIHGCRLLDPNNKFYAYANKFLSNPVYYSRRMFSELFEDQETIDDLLNRGVNNYDLDILYSVYDYFFNPNGSVATIELNYIQQGLPLGKYSITETLTGVLDRVVQANYLLTVYNDNSSVTSIKRRFYNRQEEYKLRNRVNSGIVRRDYTDRVTLSNTYPITNVSKQGNTTYNITIGDHTYTVSNKNSLGILAPSGTVITGGSFDILFNGETITLLNTEQNNRIINNENLTAQEKEFRDILKFIDDFLDLNLLTKDGLDLLYIYKNISNGKNYIYELFNQAVQANVVNNLYQKYEEYVLNLDEGMDPVSFKRFLTTVYYSLGSMDITEQSYRNYFQSNLGSEDIITVHPSANWPATYSEAVAIKSGDIARAVTKDLSGNSIANTRTGFLGANYKYYLDKYRDLQKVTKDRQLATTPLLFTNNPDLIVLTVLNTDAKSRTGIKLNVKKMSPAELLYNSIVHNFFGAFISDDKTIGKCFIIQPTTYSDKTSFVQYAISSDKPIKAEGKSYDGIALRDMNSQLITDFYIDTVGQSYKNTLNSVLLDYLKIMDLDHLPTVNEVNTWLGNVGSELNLIDIAKNHGVLIFQETHYRNKKGHLQFNELLDYYANVMYKNSSTLGRVLNTEKLNFLNDLLDSNAAFYTSYVQDFKPEESSNPVNLIIDSIYGKHAKEYRNKWVQNGRLVLAKDMHGNNILAGSRVNEQIELNPLLEKYFYMDSLLSNNLRLTLTGSEIAHPDKAKIKWNNVYRNAGFGYDPNLGKTIFNGLPIDRPFFGVNKNGKVEAIPVRDLVSFRLSVMNELNPELQNGLSNIYNAAIRWTEAVAQGTLLKRNVIIPATLQYYQLNLLNGVTSKMKVAVMYDTEAYVFNFRGDGQDEDAHDGSAHVDPFTSILENNSLQDLAVGENKKPIWHSFDERTGSATLLKFAVNTITNEKMRQSLGSRINMERMVRKMTDIPWRVNGVWLNKLGRGFNLMRSDEAGTGFVDFTQDVLKGKPLFYKDGNTHYKITDLKYDADLDAYYTLEQEVNPITGNPLQYLKTKVYQWFDDNGGVYKLRLGENDTPSKPEGMHSINSVYLLFLTFGAAYSEDLDANNGLVFSESSRFAVVNLMNKVNLHTTDNNEKTQANYYQPLKDSIINYLCNRSAMKNGQAMVNTSETYKNDSPLNYMVLDTDGYGILMDADHEADEADLTEPSQVISALESGGRVHNISKQVYQDLGYIAMLTSKLENDAVFDMLSTGDKNKLFTLVGRTIINNFKSNPDRADLAQALIDNISKEFKNVNKYELLKIKIPFSDNNLYSLILSTYASIINSKSIKRKFPGSGMVMLPGYDIIQTFRVNGQSMLFDDVLKLASKSVKLLKDPKWSQATYNKELVKQFLLKKLLTMPVFNNTDNFKPTDIINVIFKDIEDKQHVVTIDLDRPELYYNILDKQWLTNYLLNSTDNAGLKITNIAGVVEENGLFLIPDGTFGYQENITVGRNLAPARIEFDYAVLDENGNEIIKDGKPVLRHSNIFNAAPIRESFMTGNRDRLAIQQVFDDLDKGIWHDEQGRLVRVFNMLNEAAEMVSSNLYASKFGNTGMSLQDVLNQKESFFRGRTSRRVPITSSNYDIVFTKNNGQNTYISFRNPTAVNSKYPPINNGWKYTDRQLYNDPNDTRNVGKVVNRVYAISKDNMELFEVGRDILRGDLHEKDGTIYDENGKEVGKIGDQYRMEDLKIVEYKEFVHNYTITEKTSDKYIQPYLLFLIDREALKNSKLKLDDSNEDIDNYIGSLLAKLYALSSYKGIAINTQGIPSKSAAILNKSILSFQKRFRSNNDLYNLLYGIKKVLLNKFDDVDPDKADNSTWTVDMGKLKNMLDKYNELFYTKLYTSFLSSLDYTAARIPAQTLQSFMQMKQVGLTQDTKNSIFVSAWLTYLLGSDYLALFLWLSANLLHCWKHLV